MTKLTTLVVVEKNKEAVSEIETFGLSGDAVTYVWKLTVMDCYCCEGEEGRLTA